MGKGWCLLYHRKTSAKFYLRPSFVDKRNRDGREIPRAKVGITLAGDIAQPDLTDGLVVHLPFDETTGVVANDVTGNGYNAALVGYDGNATWVPGKIGGALKFDGDEFGTLPKSVF